MKIVVVGASGSKYADVASAPFRTRPDVDILRPPTIEAALEIAGGEAGSVILVAAGLEDDALFATLKKARVANVLILAKADDGELRERAFASGARDVLLPPHEPARLEDSVAVVLGRPLRKWRRCNTPLRAGIAVPGLGQEKGAVLNVSPGGVQFESPLKIPPGQIFRIAISLPPPFQMSVVFARAISGEAAANGAFVCRAQFVGLSVSEIELLENFLQTLEGSIEDFASQLRAIQRLDVRKLRDGFDRGVRLPTLVACEKTWLESPPGSRGNELAVVPLARCRAVLVTWLFDVFFASGEESPPGIPPFRQWRGELKMALDLLNMEIGANLADNTAVRELRDVQARVSTAIDAIERLAERVTGQKREIAVVRPALRDAAVRGEGVEVAIKDAAEDLLEESANAPAKSEGQQFVYKKVLAYRKTRRIVVVLLALVFGFHEHSADEERHTVYPSAVAKTDSPVLVAGMVRVRSVYNDAKTGNIIAVVDGSWFGLPQERKMEALKEIARQTNVAQGQYVEVRDYAGDLLATWIGGSRLPQPLLDGATPIP